MDMCVGRLYMMSKQTTTRPKVRMAIIHRRHLLRCEGPLLNPLFNPCGTMSRFADEAYDEQLARARQTVKHMDSLDREIRDQNLRYVGLRLWCATLELMTIQNAELHH